jgi:glycosyltransferase involved in cell wall biosynthesis
MSKDVILDKYARLYEIPNQLAHLGHQVECFCLSYQSHNEGTWDESNHEKKLIWHSKSYKGLKKLGLFTYPFLLLQQLKQYQPDIVIAASDIPHIVWGAWCAKQLKVPFIADLYDNFEGFGQAKIPFIKTLFQHALDSAQLISTTSESLAEKIKQDHPNVPHILAMPSVIDKKLFFKGSKAEARIKLNLPAHAKLVGTAGGLTKMKGIDDLFQAWEMIRQQDPDIYLVLAGPIEKDTPLPNDERVIYLGMLPHQEINYLFQSLDIGVVCIPDDDFGRYCFPQKAYEMLATDLTILSSSVGDMKNLLDSSLLYPPKDYKTLTLKINQQLYSLIKVNIEILDWKKTIEKFNLIVQRLY